MFCVGNDNVIKLTKGNSAEIDITPVIEPDKDPYILSGGDCVLFTVMNNARKKYIQKKLTSADYTTDRGTSLALKIDPADTIDMPTGNYRYDCLLITESGTVATFISSRFNIIEAFGVYTDADSDDGEPDGG